MFRLLYAGITVAVRPALATVVEDEQVCFLESCVGPMCDADSLLHIAARGKGREGALLCDARRTFPSLEHGFQWDVIRLM